MPIYLSVDEVRQLGEEQALEFKGSLSLQKKGMQSLCAMINTDAAHGTIIFGVSDDWTIKGITGNLDSTQRSLNQHIRDKFHPRLFPGVEIIDCEGKALLRVNANRPSDVPLHEYDGRVWLRVGSDNQVLTYAQQQRLRATRDRDHHTGRWRCSNCGVVLGALHTTDQHGRRFYDCDMCGAGEFRPI